MSASTIAYLDKGISAKEIYDVIIQQIDNEARFDIKMTDYSNNESGYIHFTINEESRHLFYCIVNDKENLFNGEHVSISLGYSQDSVSVLYKILSCLGGYLLENDCDVIMEKYVPKYSDLDYSGQINLRNNIISLFDESLSDRDKIQIANQIIKYKDKIIKLLQ